MVMGGSLADYSATDFCVQAHHTASEQRVEEPATKHTDSISNNADLTASIQKGRELGKEGLQLKRISCSNLESSELCCSLCTKSVISYFRMKMEIKRLIMKNKIIISVTCLLSMLHQLTVTVLVWNLQVILYHRIHGSLSQQNLF